MEMQRKRPFILILITILTLTTAWQIGLFDSDQVQAAAVVEDISEAQTRLSEIEELLSHSPTGVNALALMEQYGVQVEFAEGSGTAYRVQSNTIVIDLRHEPLMAALALVHEMNHARVLHQGLRADINNLPREEYVKMKMLEEAEGVALSIEAKIELASAGLDVSAVTFPMERQYEAALQSLSQNVPGMSDEDVAQFGQQAGKKLLYDALMSGKVRGSSSGLSYPDKFGQRWDTANAAQLSEQCQVNPIVEC
jgi:hypothetical protein